MRDRKGVFLVFEGPEGAGKTTIAELAEKELKRRGVSVLRVREPGGTAVGEAIRAILLDKSFTMPPETEFFLFQASRAAFIQQLVRPALEDGTVVVADRFDLSTMAYQIAGRGLPERVSREAIDMAIGGEHPDGYVILTVDPDIGRRRQQKQGKKPDRIESEARRFHRRVLHGYRRFGQLLPGAHVIDTSEMTVEQVLAEVMAHLDEEFGELVGAA
ncbi:MAG TPA: dTMP kinase [Candidatus Paceibacterota bacterium]|nr:dTMP kinase [Candidatus Paceibacterota bacterium]